MTQKVQTYFLPEAYSQSRWLETNTKFLVYLNDHEQKYLFYQPMWTFTHIINLIIAYSDQMCKQKCQVKAGSYLHLHCLDSKQTRTHKIYLGLVLVKFYKDVKRMSSLKEVKFHRFISSHSLDKVVGTWSEMSIYSWSSQYNISKSIELVLLTSLYFPFRFALNHFKCYRLSILIMQNIKMGKWAHLLTSLATVNVHQLSWHLHFHLINIPPSPDIS